MAKRRGGILHPRLCELLFASFAEELGEERAAALVAATKAAWSILELASEDSEETRLSAATIAAGLLAVERTGYAAPRSLRVVR